MLSPSSIHRPWRKAASCFPRSTTKRVLSSNVVAVNDDEGPKRFWSKNPETGRYQRPIFVAATRQHVGKTTVSLAVLSGIQKRFDKIGFIKPVGQQHVRVESLKSPGKEIRVDKDVELVKERFHLDHLDYEDMSPILIPRGYTKDYVDGKIAFESQLSDLESSMESVAAASDITICEGTGHCAVGSIVGLNNAKVASIMGADMLLVANGGLGSAYDELELNRVLCERYGVNVAGVVINKVIVEKYDQTREYMSKALMNNWGIPLLGCVPDRPFLGCPALADLERLFKTTLLCGEEHRFRHYNVGDINVVTTNLTRFLENLREKPKRTLYICHVTRDDLIVGFMGEHQRRIANGEDHEFEAALLICGRKKKYQLSAEISDLLQGLEGAPVMVVETSTHEATSMIAQYTPKLNIDDTNRVGVAIDHYEPYIDFDEILRRTQTD
ncbi:Phosphate acetyltransferase [Seminavis robusta]|uniref:Phosphate acetyltransferase n=1 Tax=Seminavis robusta TaxID=568900 RepID=A0A9N8EAW8_9STRA|nr:Phosphate acetyltransferase [Seminavis robusta]|eukprot:Sro821_g207390.1 Phosphate acetyltransferase (441) ;mRNA; f:29209-31027